MVPHPALKFVGLSALLLMCLLASPGAAVGPSRGAAATTPGGGVDARARAALAEILASPSDPASVDALLRLWSLSPYLSRGVYADLLERAGRARSPHQSLRLLLEYQRASLVRAREGAAAAGPLMAAQGFVRDWIVLGPFDNEGRSGVTTAYPPEAEQSDPEMHGRTYRGKDREIDWLPASASLARVALDRWIYPVVNTCSYAFTTLRTARPTAARAWAGSDGSIAVWVGGRQAIRSDRYFSAFPDRFAADVDLPAGRVPLLVKVCGDGGRIGFYLRITDRSGGPIAPPADPDPGEEDGAFALLDADPVPVDTAYQELEKRASEEGGEALLAAARALDLSGTVEVAENDAQKLLERCVDERTTPERLYWLASAATDPIRVSKARARLERLVGDDAFLLARLATFHLGDPTVGDADRLSLLALAAPGGADDALTVLVRAAVLQAMGTPGGCSAFLAPRLEAHADVPAVLSEAAACLSAEGRVDEMRALRTRLAALDRSDSAVARDVLRRLALEGDVEALRARAADVAAEFPDELGTLLDVAETLFHGGAGADAVELLERLERENPGHPSIPGDLARTLEALGRREDAVPHYRRALELQPQNQPVAEYLDYIERRQTVERRWAVEFDAIADAVAAARVELDRTDPAARATLRRGRDVFRQEVNIIHPNGLSTRFGQTYTLVQTTDGTERFRVMDVPFTPNEEAFELLRAVVYRRDGQVEDYESHFTANYYSSGFYSDSAAERIEYPRLAVGDVIEVRYRIDGRSARNKFGEHFSQEVGVASIDPTDRFLYVLVAPAAKMLFVQLPEGVSFDASTTEEGDTVARTWEARSIDAIPEEPNAPPLRELALPIQVSTFETWGDLARWWWGLAAEQLRPDESIRNKVDEILAGADTVEEKTARVFDWVIRNTRYVALEFGIHGWKPYRAHDVVSRGFGDCKDKAGLIYTMLAAAGIDARMVLLRTRAYSGKAVSDFPFLAQFDHAIAYVPELDLFLDGTMSFAAMTELATMDRGALALIVGPDGQDLVTTPIEPRTPDLSDTSLVHTLTPDGGSRVTGSVRGTGYYAHGGRGLLQADETRRRRAEEWFGYLYPGFVVGDYSVDGLDDYRAPLALDVAGEIPQLATASGDGSFSLRVCPGMSLSTRFAAADRRVLDVDLREPMHERQEHRYDLPPGTTDVHVPASREMTVGQWKFSMEVTDRGGSVTVRASLDIPDPRIPVADYGRFRAFCAAVDTALAEPITYELQ